MAVGICHAVYACDRQGEPRDPPLKETDEDAVDIDFRIDTALASPPQDQLDLKRDIERTRFALSNLFLEPDVDQVKFRPYYVQLLALARLGLRGPEAAPEIARRALDSMTAELIDREGGRIKNGHIQRLARTAAALAAPCLFIYALLRITRGSATSAWLLERLYIDPIQLSSFMLLWVGCFVGVVLSYGIRTTKMTLEDLIATDADRLLPVTRLLFAGTLSMILGLLLCLGAFEVKIAGISSTSLMSDPMIGFLVGALLGISELLLPGSVAKRAEDLLAAK